MPSALVLGNDQLEQAEIKAREVNVLLTIKTAATAGSVTITSDNPGVVPYWVGSGTPTDSGTNFPSLTNTTGSVFGLLINDGSWRQYRFANVDIDSALTPSFTAVKVIGAGQSSTPGASGYGATVSKNGAVALTVTGLTLVATATTQFLGLKLTAYQF